MKLTLVQNQLVKLLMMIYLLSSAGCGQPEDKANPISLADQNGRVNVVSVTRPNILLIVADDLGMLDIGAYGSEIRTPNIDRLAKSGVSLSNFYTSATCSPTRSMLLSGADSHIAGLGNMVEHLSTNQAGQDGYEGHLSDDVITLAQILKDAGYRTYMAGKWHLGKKPEDLPDQKGFDQSFVLLQGGASYFNDMRGLVSMVPKALYRHNGKIVSELSEDFYASEFYADFIIDSMVKDKSNDSPFFAYLSFTAPHWPLQVKDEHLDIYRGEYNQGYDELHERRIANAKRLGVLEESMLAGDKPPHISDWETLSSEKQKYQIRAMEIYSATVERMDHHLGRVLEYLEREQKLDNTLIIFMSDNGADGSDRSKLPGNNIWLPETWDLSYENMGKKGSYVYPGAGWARASVGPFNLYKSFLSEGGIRSPAIVSYANHIPSESRLNQLVSVKDIAPTILEAAGVAQPKEQYNGKIVQPMTGISFLSAISNLNDTGTIAATERVLGWELFGQRAIRKGDWKLLWLSSKPNWLIQPVNSDQWRLYNLKEDPTERNDLSQENPEKLAELLADWEEYSETNNVILPVWK